MITGASGKKVVFPLIGVVLLLVTGLLWYGLSRTGRPAGEESLSPDAAAFLYDLPREWTRISLVEGQGWVIFVPCHAEAGSLILETDAASPRLLCAWCDSIEQADVIGASPAGIPGRLELMLDDGGSVLVETVDDDVTAQFPEAPVRDYVLTWTLPGGKAMFFVPSLHAGEFETLRAEDESPEGCRGD